MPTGSPCNLQALSRRTTELADPKSAGRRTPCRPQPARECDGGHCRPFNGAAKVFRQASAAAKEDEAVDRRAMPLRQPEAAME